MINYTLRIDRYKSKPESMYVTQSDHFTSVNENNKIFWIFKTIISLHIT